MGNIEELLSSLSIKPNDLSLYEEALTHSSFNATAKTKHVDYERLEFLGDSLVGFVTSELCFRYHPEMQQGDLTRLRSRFIRTEGEAALALELNLGSYVRVGNSFGADAKTSSRILEDVFESFVGALVLDQGKEFAHQFVWNLFEKEIEVARFVSSENPKSELQEAIQAEFKEAVTYELLSEEGSANDKRYSVGAFFEGLELGRGSGKRNKEAATEAAKDALRKNAMASLAKYSEGKK